MTCTKTSFVAPVHPLCVARRRWVLATGIKGPFAHQDTALIQSCACRTYNGESHPVLLCTYMSYDYSKNHAAPVEQSAGSDRRTGWCTSWEICPQTPFHLSLSSVAAVDCGLQGALGDSPTIIISLSVNRTIKIIFLCAISYYNLEIMLACHNRGNLLEFI